MLEVDRSDPDGWQPITSEIVAPEKTPEQLAAEKEELDLLMKQHFDAEAKAKLRKKGQGRFGSDAVADRAKRAGYPIPAQFNAERWRESLVETLLEENW